MKLWTRFLAWRFLRREAAHRRWLRQEHVVYTTPPEDWRQWSNNYMRSVRQRTR